MVKKSKSKSRGVRGMFSGGLVKKLVLAFGAIGIGTMISQATGFNQTLATVAPAWLIGGPIVALMALAVGMFSNGGLNLGSLTGRAIPANPNVSVQGTVYA